MNQYLKNYSKNNLNYEKVIKSFNKNKLKENEWRCKCGEFNSYGIYVCKKCNKKNDIMEIAIKQYTII